MLGRGETTPVLGRLPPEKPNELDEKPDWLDEVLKSNTPCSGDEKRSSRLWLVILGLCALHWSSCSLGRGLKDGLGAGSALPGEPLQRAERDLARCREERRDKGL